MLGSSYNLQTNPTKSRYKTYTEPSRLKKRLGGNVYNVIKTNNFITKVVRKNNIT